MKLFYCDKCDVEVRYWKRHLKGEAHIQKSKKELFI